MSEKVKLSKDGSSIDFIQTDSIPTSLKKFRQSPEIEGFYRFMYENDLQKEAYEILDRIINSRKSKKAADKAAQKNKEKEAARAIKDAEKMASSKAKEAVMARRLEAKYSKKAILSVYLNHIYLGAGAWGVFKLPGGSAPLLHRAAAGATLGLYSAGQGARLRAAV